MNLDTVVVMGLVRHPMYVVVISSPIDSSDIFLYAFTCTRCVRMHACTHIYILYMYVCAQGLSLPFHSSCIVHCVTMQAVGKSDIKSV